MKHAKGGLHEKLPKRGKVRFEEILEERVTSTRKTKEPNIKEKYISSQEINNSIAKNNNNNN